MLSAKDINNKKFEQTRPGYKPEEVDDFLREIAMQITKMNEEIARVQSEHEELKGKMDVLVKKIREYKDDEDALKDALIGAQKQGRAVIQEANENAEKIIAEAHVKADEIIGNTRVQLEKEKRCLSKMQQEVSEFKANLLSMYKSHLEQITSIPDFDDDDEEEEVPVQAEKAPEQPVAEQHAVNEPEPAPQPQNMEATRVMDSSLRRERQAQAFPFADTSNSSDSKFGNLKFGQNK